MRKRADIVRSVWTNADDCTLLSPSPEHPWQRRKLRYSKIGYAALWCSEYGTISPHARAPMAVVEAATQS